MRDSTIIIMRAMMPFIGMFTAILLVSWVAFQELFGITIGVIGLVAQIPLYRWLRGELEKDEIE